MTNTDIDSFKTNHDTSNIPTIGSVRLKGDIGNTLHEKIGSLSARYSNNEIISYLLATHSTLVRTESEAADKSAACSRAVWLSELVESITGRARPFEV